MLALIGWHLGLHCFYLGERKKGGLFLFWCALLIYAPAIFNDTPLTEYINMLGVAMLVIGGIIAFFVIFSNFDDFDIIYNIGYMENDANNNVTTPSVETPKEGVFTDA